MKRLLISIALLLVALFAFAQPTTTIKGNHKNAYKNNSYYNRTRLKISWFDIETLTLKEEIINGQIKENGDFIFLTDKIVQDYTQCWLELGNNSTQLCLSPGDSLYLSANKPIFDESLKYSGDGAAINTYRKEVDKHSKLLPVLNEINKSYKKKLEVLDEYYSNQQIDSSFFAYEKTNLDFEYYLKIINHYTGNNYIPQIDSGLRTKIDSIIEKLDFQNENLLRYSNYRGLIRAIPDLMSLNNDENGLRMDKAIEYAEHNYSNKIKQYYLSHLVDSSLKNAKSPVEKNILLDYFNAKIDSPVIAQLIDKHQQELIIGRHYSSKFLEIGTILSLCIIGFLLLFLMIKKLLKHSGFKGFQINSAKGLKYAIYAVILFFLVIILGESHGNPLMALLVMVLLVSIFAIHTYIIIPKIALKKSKWYYAGIFLFIYFFFLALIFLDKNTKVLHAKYISAALMLVLGFITFSWINYYIHLLAIKKTTLKGLFKERYVNLEVVFNLLLLFFVIGTFTANLNYRSSIDSSLTFYTAILLFYLQALVVIPRYLRKNKWVHFVLYNALIFVVIATSMIITDAITSYYSLKSFGVTASLSDLISLKAINTEQLTASLFIIVPAFAYSYIKAQIRSQESIGFRLFRKKEAELAHLRSQVNPHFLFNTLNTLYAFALTEKSDKTAEVIAKLANLMRFMIDDMEKESIPLKKEVSYIQDYIKLQSIRSSVEHEININIEVEDNESYQVAPMLFIPFVENAFKHGLNPNKVSQLNIDIKARDNKIQFVIENSVDRNFEAYYKEKGFGIGIENVKSRLEHIYPNQHNISIAQTNDKFIVIINISTN